MERNYTHRDKLDLERVRVLYSNARFSVAGVFVSALFFSLFLWDSVDPQIWGIWLSAILAINLPRLLLVEVFHRRLRHEQLKPGKTAGWERLFLIGVLLSALSWGAVSLLPFSGDPTLSLVYAALFLIAISSASIVTLITSLTMGLTFLSVAVLPLVARCLLAGEGALLILGLACLTYYVIFIQMACRLHYAIIDNITLRIENEELSLKDALTGLWNRRQLYLFIEHLQSRYGRSGETFSLILIDLDHFKDYNDSMGHNAGDELLVKVAEIIMQESRDEDLAVRYGGEEFLVVLPRAGVRQASQVAERIRSRMAIHTGGSLSAGIVGYRQEEGFEKMVARADEALYAAKSQGRNQVIAYANEELSG